MALKPVMLVRPPLGILYDEGFWDEMAEAGINEVAIQWLALLDDRGDEGNRYPQEEDTHPRGLAAVGGVSVMRVPVGAYAPNPSLYEGLPFPIPEFPAQFEDESVRLKSVIEKQAARGFRIWIMDDKGYFMSGGFGNPLRVQTCTNDPDLASYAVTRTRDTMANFPWLHGIFLDGPGFRWEIKPGHRDDMWVQQCGCQHCERIAESIGITYERVLEGRDAFRRRLNSLTPESVDDFIANRGGVMGGLDWWSEEPATLDWMRFKATVVEGYVSSVCGGLRRYFPELKIGTSTRMPALAPLTGHVVRRLQTYNDYEMSKLYWWAGGVAGFRGTVVNWVNTLAEWNPSLSTDDATRWFSAALDIPLPDDYPPSAYDDEATDAWFDTSVDDQIRKMLAECGGPDRFMPWVGLEHFGSKWLSATELRRLLERMEAQGAKRYAYFVFNSMTPDIWDVITDFSRD